MAKKKKKTKVELLVETLVNFKEMGWNIAMPSVGQNDEIPGLIVGTPQYVDQVCEALDQGHFRLKISKKRAKK